MIENSVLNELLKKGLEYHKNNKFIEALEIYKKILIEDSDHFETNFYMGTLLAQTKKFTEASSHIIKAIKIKPEIQIRGFENLSPKKTKNCSFQGP